MSFIQETLQIEDGSLALYISTSEGKTKGVVHINHGMCEHAGRYERFMRYLSQSGYHAIAQDHRGHGKTEFKDAPRGTFAKTDGWSKVIEDAKTVNALIPERFGNLPIITFGHSMGAAVALDYVLTYPDTTSAAAIWNSGMSGIMPRILANLLKIERALKGSDCASSWAPALSFDTWNKEFKPNRTASDWLSRDETEVDKYIIDPACDFNANIGMWIDLLNGLNETAQLERYAGIKKDMPFHILNGDQDPCSNKGGSANQLEKRLQKLGFSNVTKTILQGARHESLNEINRDEVMADFISWLNQRFSL